MKKSDIICVFVPYWVKHTFSEIDYPYKWEWDDGTYYSIMSKEEYEKYIEDDWDRIKNLEEENKYLKSEIRRITYQRDNLSSIADNLVDENRYLEKENDRLKEVEYENKKLKAELEEADKAKMNALNWMSDLSRFCVEQVKKLEQENRKLKEELWKFIMKS